MEIELKLAIPLRALSRLRRHALLRGAKTTRMVRSVYYDTPALDLLRRGMVFRVRRDGRQWLQALKGGGNAQAGLHQRMELETKLAGPQPDFAALVAMPAASAFAPYASTLQLIPAFVTSFQRASKIITYKQSVSIDAAIDQGCITSTDGTAPICELELELKAGAPVALFEFALTLLETVPLEIENRSKAERGYALFRNESLQPEKARAPDLTAQMSALDAFEVIVGTLLAQVQANRRGVIEGHDVEYLHQMRVALRRLRAIFGVYRKILPKAALQPHLENLKWLARALGPARDADVFVSEIWPPLRAALGNNSMLTALDARWTAQQRSAAAKVRRALTSRRYQRLMLGLGRWLVDDASCEGASPEQRVVLDGPARDLARRVLERRNEKVRGHGHALTKLDDRQLHALRIEIKKLRYAVDSFGALLEAVTVQNLLKNLARLQDILGALNDIHVAERHLLVEIAHRRGRTVTRLREGLVAWREMRSAKLRLKLGDEWRAFRELNECWQRELYIV